jgi:imidazolonepropionase
MLRAIHDAAARWHGTVVPTALLGHALDPAQPDFPDRTIRETLPAIHAEFPRVAIDAFVERGAWSIHDARRLFEHAAALGHPLRLHADQFNSLGGVPLAVDLAARSVDHLEASTDDDLRRLALSPTFGVGLPVCGLHLDGRFARLGHLARLGGAVAIATNSNPGSAPSRSMPLAIALAVRKCGLTISQAIFAATANPAALLDLADRGTIEPGRRADLILLRSTDERDLAYELGGNPVAAAWCAGRRLV